MRTTLAVRDRTLATVGIIALSLGIAAFLLHVVGWVRMPFTLTFLSVPGLVVVAVLAAYAKRANRAELLRRLRTGLVAGIWATLAYDAVRAGVMLFGLTEFNAFQSHPLFGSLITGQSPDAFVSHMAGWIYHFWNGISFAMMYTLVAAGRRWVWGLGWAMFLEIAMVFTYPVAFGVSRANSGFLFISVVGHAVYGVVLGKIVQRMPREQLAGGWL